MLLSVLIALLTVGGALWLRYRYRRVTWLRRCGFPGPRASLLTGNTFDMRRAGRRRWHELMITRYGRVVGYCFPGPRAAVLVADHAMIKEILVKKFAHFVDKAVRAE